MNTPKVADDKPMLVQLEPGEHYWCACGRSQMQPFCDGSHMGTGIEPVAISVIEPTEAWLCMCKKTGKVPFCDGSHTTLGKGKARIAGRQPMALQLDSGEYAWCACGLSQNQPFCDGSHVGTGIEPVVFSVSEPTEAWLCLCKQTATAPYCDGSHNRVPEGTRALPSPYVHRTQGAAASEPAPASQAAPASAMPQPVNTPEEPTVEYIHRLAREGLSVMGAHGPLDAMGVPRSELPDWNDIQIMTAQFARQPLLDDAPVTTQVVIGPKARKPLVLDMPLLVADMSFGALSPEAKIALAQGAERAGTGICSGEGGMLPAEQQSNSRYFYELASARFGWSEAIPGLVQAFHFKGGQAAKTGTGGHLPGRKVTDQIAAVRGLQPGQDAISPATFVDLHTPADFRALADQVRERSGGIPIGFKLSAQHIERDIDFALEASADYIILDGRGGGTGAAPLLFRDHISVPTMAALARARRHLDRSQRGDVSLIITGGLRTPADFIKALCLGADAVALGNSAIQAIGCVGARMCHTNNCPAGIATQRPELRARLKVDEAAARLERFLCASTSLMQVMARACGHSRLADFCPDDLSSWKKDIAELAGIRYAGVSDAP